MSTVRVRVWEGEGWGWGEWEGGALWEMSTPLGLPVVPEVYLVRARVEDEG